MSVFHPEALAALPALSRAKVLHMEDKRRTAFMAAREAEDRFNDGKERIGKRLDLRRKCAAVIRATRAALSGHSFDHVHALVGDDFFDDLLQHREVRETYKGWDEAKILRDSYVGKSNSKGAVFEFGGIVWENYGKTAAAGDGALIGIDTDLAKFFPVGANGVFTSFYAPADYVETVNTPGLRRYAKQWRMPNDKGILGETQTNVLHICAKPNVLQSGRRGV